MTEKIAHLLRVGKLDEAARLLETPSQVAEYWRARGVFHAWRHQWADSQSAFQRALDHQSADAEWWCDVGLALIGANAAEQALAPLQKSLAIKETPRALVHLGEALELLSREAEAYDEFARAAKIQAGCSEAVEGLVRAACRLGRDEEALRHAKRAARLRRFDARSLQIVADMQFYSAQLQTCLRTYRRAMRRDPDAKGIYSAYLFASIHDPRQTPASLRAIHEEWFRRHAPKRDGFAFHPRKHVKPRIGYVSIEFRSSPTEYFLLPLLEAHDREQFDVYCYHLSRASDQVTEKYKRVATHWREIGACSEDETLRIMREDELDILVDTSGHFAPDLLGVLARRAAPIQIFLPSYPATSGCPEMDYILTDRWATPDHAAEAQYVEKVLRLPAGYVVYAPPADAPAVSDLPAKKNGYVTFGLFQRPAKFNEDLWRTIGEVLGKTPGSHLLVHHGTCDLENPRGAMLRCIVGTLAEQGISEERIDFVGRRGLREHLETVARCDIALDTFPYSGHTTSGDALWMGVPVVTLAGDRHASRISCGLLSRIGLEEWVAHSTDEYVAIAVRKAGDWGALAQLRGQLRRRMADSSIVQARRVVRELEEIYRWIIEQVEACADSEQSPANHATSAWPPDRSSGLRTGA